MTSATKTLTPDAWAALCARQLARALAGDARASEWCARYAPRADGAPEQNLDLTGLTAAQIRLLAGECPKCGAEVACPDLREANAEILARMIFPDSLDDDDGD